MTITSYAKFLMTLAVIGSLSACAGGGSTDISSVVTPPVDSGTGTSTDGSNIDDVIALAKSSGTYYALDNGVKRYFSSKTENGVEKQAWVDSIPGIGDAVVGFRDGDNQEVYTLNADATTNVTALSGVYTGLIDMSYRLSEGGQWQVISGNASLNLDLTNGTAALDSIASNDNDTFEVFGNATVSGSTLSTDSLTVRHRDAGGNFVKDYTGSIDDGRIVTGANGPENSAVIGTISSGDADGFTMNGVFDTQYSTQNNAP